MIDDVQVTDPDATTVEIDAIDLDHVAADGGEFVVEAPSVDAAVADVEARTGRTPEVLEVERIARGGIGGFFAKEVARVRVRVPAPASRPAEATTVSATTTDPRKEILDRAGERIAEARPRGVDSVLQALASANDERERDFEAQLREALQRGEPVRPSEVAREVRVAAADRAGSTATPAAPTVASSSRDERPLQRADTPLFAAHPEPPADVQPWSPARIEPAGPPSTALVRSSTANRPTVAAPKAVVPSEVVPSEVVPSEVVPSEVVPSLGELVAAPPTAREPAPTSPVAPEVPPTPQVPPAREAPPTREELAAQQDAAPTAPEHERGSLIPASILARIHGEPTDESVEAGTATDEVVEGVLVEDEAVPSVPAPAPEGRSARDTAADVLPRPRPLDRGAPIAHRNLAPGALWTRAALYGIGIPGTLLDRLDVPQDADEFTWLRAVSEAVLPWCRPLPTGSAVLAGPRAGTLGRLLDLATCEKGGRPPYGGDVALVATDSPSGRQWLDEVRGDRWLHLVAGGRRWEGLVAATPRAVSVVGRGLLPEVLALCVSFDLVLGHLADDTRAERAIRLRPLDVALAIRDALPRAEGA